MVIDENGESPVALFLMNVIDYINEYGQIGFEDKTFNEVDAVGGK